MYENMKMFADPLPALLASALMLHIVAASPYDVNDLQGHNIQLLNMEGTLVNKWLEHYRFFGKTTRPVKNSTKAIDIRISLRLIQMDIDEKDQTLKTSVWFKMIWQDEYVRWKPHEKDNLYTISLPWQEVWVPDISLVNTAETEEKQRDADVLVSHIGFVEWVPQRTYKSACLLDITNYPYDQHNCSMWFQSMVYSKEALNLLFYGPKNSSSVWDLDTYLESYAESQEWEITGHDTKLINDPRELGSSKVKYRGRPAIKFTLVVRRRLGYTGHLLMLPCVFLASMSIVVFMLPPERPDRHSLAMSLFASFMVLLLVLVEVAPPTAASVPKLAVYYAFNLTLVMIAVFLSGTVIHISRLGDNKTEVPHVLKVIFIDILARVLFMYGQVSKIYQTVPPHRKENAINSEEQNGLTPSPYPGIFQYDDTLQPMEWTQTDNDESPDNFAAMKHLSVVVSRLERRMKKVEKVVSRTLSETISAADHEQEVRILRVKWRNLSQVLDRLCIILYIMAIIISLIVLFPRPH